MRKRLKQLKQPIYGTKQQLWSRLTQAELRRRAQEEEMQALADQQEARIRGDMEADVVPVRLPVAPSQEARELHI